jgi:adenine-specific DNA-methyltransferase
MALIDDLLTDVPDPALRHRLHAEIAALRKETKFGLVFERHLPELVPIYGARPRRGSRVARRNGGIVRTFIVRQLANGTALCQPEGTGDPESIAIDDLTVVKRFGESIFPSLQPVEVIRGCRANNPHHLLIEAENYHALQLLEWLYPARIDCIYVDPPYNTGARDWKYNNHYVDAADSWRHSKWLAFMRRRLLIARRLLKPDGVLIVTIDEHEVHHLGMLLEDIFRDYLQHMVTIVINPKGTGKLNFSRVDEYAIFCVPDLGASIISGEPTLAAAVDEESGDTDAENGDDLDEPAKAELLDDTQEFPFPAAERDLWELRHARRRGGESSYRQQRWRQFYPLWIDAKPRKVIRAGESLPLSEQPFFEPHDGLVPLWPIDAEDHHRCWRLVPASMQQLIDQGRVVLGRYNPDRNTWTVNLWVRKAQERRPRTVWGGKQSTTPALMAPRCLTRCSAAVTHSRFPNPSTPFAIALRPSFVIAPTR